MAKVTRIKFLTNYYDAGQVKYAQGEHYPKTAETNAQALQGHAEEIEVDMDADAAAVSAAAVKAAAVAQTKSDADAVAKGTKK